MFPGRIGHFVCFVIGSSYIQKLISEMSDLEVESSLKISYDSLFINLKKENLSRKDDSTKWAASSEYGTYRLCEQ